jgi:hypothetical protein
VMRSAVLVAGMLVTAIALGGAVLIANKVPPPASAQERQNCPPGFTWDRLSGIGCVQELLPANAHYSYEGYSICEEGYAGEYERRNTTDGQPAPGTPYTSFAYLLSCTSGGTAGSQGFSGFAGDVADRLYDSGGAPSPETLAAAGVLAAGAAALAATGGRIPGGWGLKPGGLSPEQIAKLEEMARKLADLDRKIAEARKAEDAAKKSLDELLKNKTRLAQLGDRFAHTESHLKARSYAEWKNAFRADLQDDALALAGSAATLAGILSSFGLAGAAALQGEVLFTSIAAGWTPGTTALATAKAESWLGWRADNLPGIFGKVPIGARGEKWRNLQALSDRMVRSVKACKSEAEAAIVSLEDKIQSATADWQEASRVTHELEQQRQGLYNTYEADKAYYGATAQHKQYMDRIYEENRWRPEP